MKPTIRAATPADLEPLLGLIRDHAQFERATATLPPEALARILDDAAPPVTVLVAAVPGELAGYGALTLDFSLWRGRWWGHLDCLFVREKWRGRAIGRALLGAVEAAASARGADRLEWQTPAWNERGIAFYTRGGAQGVAKMRFGIML